MDGIRDAREAKEFLISKVVAEAQLENALLSETERKMLYFHGKRMDASRHHAGQ